MTTILVIEDSASQRAQIRTALEASGLVDRILEAEDGLRGLKMILSEPVDLVLCDLELPGLQGDKLLRMKGAVPGGHEVPFLVVTGVTDPDRRARLLRNGASDAITKPYHTADLIARIELHLKMMNLQRQLLEKNEQLEQLCTTDALTGLRNRRFLDEMIGVEFQRARRYGTPLSIVMADLDHFKRINDRYGHAAGDVTLREVARRLTENLRDTDFGGRYGGEEFLVILVNNSPEGAKAFANRWREAMQRDPIQVDEETWVRVTLSVGISTFEPEQRSAKDLLKAADAALYRAKAAGRNRVESS